MAEPKKAKFIFLLAAYIGTVVGVGMYGLPYVVSRAGVGLFLGYLALISLLVYFGNMVFADVVMRSERQERFLGYVGEYVGKKSETFFTVTMILSFWGTFLVYLLVWGRFAQVLFGPWVHVADLVFSSLLFIVTAAIIYRGSKTVQWLDTFILGAIFLFFIVFFAIGADHLRSLSLSPVSQSFILLPYGTVMFSLWGINIIPELVNQSNADAKKMKRVFTWGVFITAAAYAIFAFFVASITGTQTTKEAIDGLQPFLGRPAVIIGSAIGICTIFLSYINLGWSSRNMMMIDLKRSKPVALAIILLPPYLLLLFGVSNAVVVMSVIGAIFLGLESAMIFFLYHKSLAHNGAAEGMFKKRIHPIFIYGAMILFLLGALLEFWMVLKDIFFS